MKADEALEELKDLMRIFERHGYSFIVGSGVNDLWTRNSELLTRADHKVFGFGVYSTIDSSMKHVANHNTVGELLLSELTNSKPRPQDYIYPVKIDFDKIDKTIFFDKFTIAEMETLAYGKIVVQTKQFMTSQFDGYINKFCEIMNLLSRIKGDKSILEKMKADFDKSLDAWEEYDAENGFLNFKVNPKWKEKLLRFIKDFEQAVIMKDTKVLSRKVINKAFSGEVEATNGIYLSKHPWAQRFSWKMAYSPFNEIRVFWKVEDLDDRLRAKVVKNAESYLNINIEENERTNCAFGAFHERISEKPNWSYNGNPSANTLNSYIYDKSKSRNRCNYLIFDVVINNFKAIGCEENEITDFIPEM